MKNKERLERQLKNVDRKLGEINDLIDIYMSNISWVGKTELRAAIDSGCFCDREWQIITNQIKDLKGIRQIITNKIKDLERVTHD